MVRDIRSVALGQRVANIYDVNEKIYLFKFAIPGSTEKLFLLLESGIRFHMTKYTRDKNDMPSPFAFKLRKYIRTKRLEDIHQLGIDRVVDMKFGSGDAVNHIILELYANGNIILTDNNYEILALLRSHQFDAAVAIKVGEIYPINVAVNLDYLIFDSNNCGIHSGDSDLFIRWASAKLADQINWQGSSDKKDKLKKMNLRQLFLLKDSGASSLGPEIIDHCLLSSGYLPSTKVESMISSFDQSSISILLVQLTESKTLVKLLDEPGLPGYVIYKSMNAPVSSSTLIDTGGDDINSEILKEYIEFVPRLFKQHEGKPHLEFPSFDEAVDEYYCKLEDQKLQIQAAQAEGAAKKKIDKVKGEQAGILKSLSDQQTRMELGAMLIEAYADEINKVSLVLNSAISNGMTWEDIAIMVENETASGNPIASLIRKLKLERNHAILKLKNLYDENSDDSDSDGSDFQAPKKVAANAYVEVEIDIGISAHANARKMFGVKKVARVKEEKTLLVSQRVIESVEATQMRNLESQKLKRNLLAVRKVHWFEKFNWFISSEGYLILSGRDAQQNEALVKRYLRHGDVYVHAEIPGASSCIIRAKKPLPLDQQPKLFSPFALHEAGNMTVCRSKAWGAKIVTSAWWVWASQVSKKAPSGEYLTTGSFMIYGKKNFLPPMNLEMGFGVMFRLDDSSVTRHLNDHKDRSSHFDDTQSLVSEALDRYGLEFEGLEEADDDDDDVLELRDIDIDDEDDHGQDRQEEDEVVEDSTRIEKEVDEVDLTCDSQILVTNSLQQANEIEEGRLEAAFDGNGGGNNIKPPRQEREEEVESESDISLNVDDEEDSREADTAEKNLSSVDRSQTKKLNSDINRKLTPRERKLIKKNKNKLPEQDEKDAVKFQPKSTQDNAKAKDKSLALQSTASETSVATVNKKKINKKKMRRYLDQDDEDRELAMIALGHLKLGEVKGEKAAAVDADKRRIDTEAKMAKAGVNLLKEDWSSQMMKLPVEVRLEIENLIAQGYLREGELDTCEIRSLELFNAQQGLEVLKLFTGGSKDVRSVSNKSGYLAGIMRRYSKEHKRQTTGAGDIITQEVGDASIGESQRDVCTDSTVSSDLMITSLSRRQKKVVEQKEILSIMEDEGILDEEEGKQADEIEKLTGVPHVDDVLICAVPVCAPYISLQGFKYKIKLTPGTLKKGKAVKQAIEVFTRSKECSALEKGLMRGLTDPEMVAIMIGDVKLSTPGLQKVQRGQKQEKKKK